MVLLYRTCLHAVETPLSRATKKLKKKMLLCYWDFRDILTCCKKMALHLLFLHAKFLLHIFLLQGFELCFIVQFQLDLCKMLYNYTAYMRKMFCFCVVFSVFISHFIYVENVIPVTLFRYCGCSGHIYIILCGIGESNNWDICCNV